MFTYQSCLCLPPYTLFFFVNLVYDLEDTETKPYVTQTSYCFSQKSHFIKLKLENVHNVVFVVLPLKKISYTAYLHGGEPGNSKLILKKITIYYK